MHIEGLHDFTLPQILELFAIQVSSVAEIGAKVVKLDEHQVCLRTIVIAELNAWPLCSSTLLLLLHIHHAFSGVTAGPRRTCPGAGTTGCRCD